MYIKKNTYYLVGVQRTTRKNFWESNFFDSLYFLFPWTIFKNYYHWIEVKSMGQPFIETMQINKFDLPQKTWKKNHQNRAEKYSDRNKLIPSLTTELALLKICLVSKRYELQNVKPNEDMLRGKKEGKMWARERYNSTCV